MFLSHITEVINSGISNHVICFFLMLKKNKHIKFTLLQYLLHFKYIMVPKNKEKNSSALKLTQHPVLLPALLKTSRHFFINGTSESTSNNETTRITLSRNAYFHFSLIPNTI